MDFSGSLDLCLSCGNHVADGTAYCSNRCLSLDRSARRNLGCTSQSSHHIRVPSEEHLPRHRSSSSSQRQRYQQDVAGPSSSSHSDEEEFYFEDIAEADPSQVQKLASIAEWAEGVWGGAPSSDEDDSALRRQHGSRPINHPKMERRIVLVQDHSPSHSRSPKPSSASRRRPQFTLSVAHVAPPAMSITTSMDDDTSSSIMTPSSSSSPRIIQQHRRKPSGSSAMDPFIASPPYEFAYNHGHKDCGVPMPVEKLIRSGRGRALTRA